MAIIGIESVSKGGSGAWEVAGQVVSEVLSAAAEAPWWAVLSWSLVPVFLVVGLLALRTWLTYRLVLDLGRRGLAKVSRGASMRDLASLCGAVSSQAEPVAPKPTPEPGPTPNVQAEDPAAEAV